MRNTAFLIVFLLASACTDDTDTIRTLNSSGYTDIHTTGYRFFACGQGDDFSTGFRAKNQTGQIVTGTVCCGLLKNCTVRF